MESDAARAAEVKARSAPGRPANGAQHEDDSVSSTSGASTERSHQSAAPAAHGRMEGPGKARLASACLAGFCGEQEWTQILGQYTASSLSCRACKNAALPGVSSEQQHQCHLPAEENLQPLWGGLA